MLKILIADDNVHACVANGVNVIQSDLERGLARSEEWSRRPLPRVNVPPPQNITNPADLVGRARLMFDIVHLALQTDSTRLITLLLLPTLPICMDRIAASSAKGM